MEITNRVIVVTWGAGGIESWNGSNSATDGWSKEERTYERSQRSEAVMQRVWLYGWDA